MRLTDYTIEVRNPVLGYWKTVHMVTPTWDITEQLVEHHFLFFKWEEIHKKYHNESKSIEACREIAILWALEFYREPNEDVRVRKTYRHSDGFHQTVTVWENGEWKDC